MSKLQHELALYVTFGFFQGECEPCTWLCYKVLHNCREHILRSSRSLRREIIDRGDTFDRSLKSARYCLSKLGIVDLRIDFGRRDPSVALLNIAVFSSGSSALNRAVYQSVLSN